MSRSPSNAELSDVLVLAAGGNKIAAIKLYRELTSAGLAEAKRAVETIEAGRTIGAAPMAAGSNDDIDEIQAAVFAGNKIKAIKLYRAATGKGFKESKGFVDKLENELRRTEPARFAGPTAKGYGMAVLAIVTAACCVGFVAAGRSIDARQQKSTARHNVKACTEYSIFHRRRYTALSL